MPEASLIAHKLSSIQAESLLAALTIESDSQTHGL